MGEQHGSNLFHSFERFSIGQDETATFTGPDPIDGPQSVSNVISHVTGGDPSAIDGTLRSTIPGADLWLLNPSGIVFGEGAQLDVPGSFHASTGDYVGLGEGGLERFYADRSRPSVLSTASPGAFGFLGENATAPISVTGATLAVPDGGALELVGGAVTLTRATLDAPGGAVSIRGGRIVVEEGSRVLAENAGERPAGTITVDAAESMLVENGLLSVNTSSAGDAGTIQIEGGPVVLRGGSGFVPASPRHYDTGVTAETSGSGDAGTITIDAKSLEVTEGSNVSAQTVGASGVEASGEGGTIHLVAESIHVSDRASIVADSWASRGDAGEITIGADRLMIDGVSDFFTGVSADSLPRIGEVSHASAGSIAIDAGSVRVADHAFVNASCSPCDGERPGRIQIRTEALTIESGGTINATTNGPGAAGTIEVRADSVQIGPGEGSFIHATSFLAGGNPAQGAAGFIDVEATRSIVLTNEGASELHPFLEALQGRLFTGIFSATIQGGDGGSIRLKAPAITVTDGASVATTSLGGGRGGDVLLEGEHLLVANGGVVDSTSLPYPAPPFSASGDAGTVRLVASESIGVVGSAPGAQLLGGTSRVSSLSMGSGAAGAVILTAPRIVVDGGAVLTTALPSALGREGTRGGSITLDAERLLVANGGQVDASTFITGAGGRVEVAAEESIVVAGVGSSIASRTGGPGTGGGVRLVAPRIEIEEGGEISARSEPGFGELSEIAARIESILIGEPPERASGNAGTVSLAADTLLLEGGALATNAETADGGDITIQAKQLVHLDAGEITASVSDGAGGNITIDPEVVILQNGSRIVADAGTGSGGNIQITADNYFAFPGSRVDASSDLGIDGIVEVHTPDVNLAGTLTALPASYLDAASLMRERCAARRSGERAGSFAVRGNDGIPAEPDGWLPATVGLAGTPSLGAEPAPGSNLAAPLLAATSCR